MVPEDMLNSHQTKSSGSSSSPSPRNEYRPGEPLTNTPPHFPIPDLPPNDVYSSCSQTTPTIRPVPPKPSARPHTSPSNEKKGDVRGRRETFSSSKPSSSKSLTCRFLEELNNFQQDRPNHHHHHHRRRQEGNTVPSGSSPTDSHPAHRHRRPHSRARSSSDSISSLLLITTERLAQETARANEAERQAAEVLAAFKTIHEAKARLERDVNRVKEELGLYKIQLDLAQKEIFRAQDVVDKLDRQRADAEDEAVRSREKVRVLMETRAVELAMEEGRRLGFEEGLRQGRFVHPAPEAVAQKSRSRRHSSRAEDDRGSAVSRNLDPESGSSGSARSSGTHKSIPRPTGLEPQIPTRPISQPAPSTTTHPHGTPPDVARFSKRLPIRTLTTPMDVGVPSTQPQPPVPMPPHQSALHDHTTKPAEKITIQPSADPNSPLHPIPIYDHSPTISHRSIVVPPDNYIPTLKPDSKIYLPPPHEFSQPVPPEALPIPPPTQPTSRSKSNSRAPDALDNEGNYEAHPYADRDKRKQPSRSRRDAEHESRRYAAAARSMSITSPGSTRLSQLDLLSPPRHAPAAGGNYRGPSRQDAESSTSERRSRPRAATQPTTKGIVEQWRNANPEYRTPTPPSASIALKQEEIEIQSPLLAASATSQRIPSSTVYGSRPIRTPRRPREIVMPVPLGDSLLMSNNDGRSDALAPQENYNTQPTILNTQRAASDATDPVIDVITPTDTSHSNLSQRTVIDPVLLTPESANRIPPPEYSALETHSASTSHTHIGEAPSNNNPPGSFVPLSPIPGMGNLNPYPPGFAPSLPKDHPTGSSPDFKYPASPLMR